jgi:hypothetical protein
MGITYIIDISLIFIVIILFIIFAIITLYKYLKKRILQKAKKTPEIILVYLDRYYIKNIFFVFAKIFIYVIINFSLFLFLRSKYLSEFNISKNINLTSVIDIKTHILGLIINIFLILIALTFFKLSLDKLFFDEIIKIHFFFLHNDYYVKFRHFINEDHIIGFFGKCYLFFYNICKLRTLRDLNSNDDHWDFYLYETIYDVNNIYKLSEACIVLSLKYKIILYWMLLLKTIFKTLYYHMRLHNGIIPYIPRILFMFALFHNYFQNNTNNIIYIFFTYYFINTIINCFIFITNKNPMIDNLITNYFYSKDSTYIFDRIHLKANFISYFQTFQNSDKNYSLISRIKNLDILKYIIKDFDFITQISNEKDIKILNALYKKIVIIVFYLLCSIMIFAKNKLYFTIQIYNIKIELISVWMPLLFFIIYIMIKTHKIIRENSNNKVAAIYSSNKGMILLFWMLWLISTCFLCGIYIGNISKGMDIIFTISIIEIVRHYTIEEKTLIFHEYFQKYVEQLGIKGQHLANLQLFLDELKIETLIFKDTTIKDLTLSIEDLLITYVKVLEEHFHYRNEIRNFMGTYIIPITNVIVLFNFSKMIAKTTEKLIIYVIFKFYLVKQIFLIR